MPYAFLDVFRIHIQCKKQQRKKVFTFLTNLKLNMFFFFLQIQFKQTLQ